MSFTEASLGFEWKEERWEIKWEIAFLGWIDSTGFIYLFIVDVLIRTQTRATRNFANLIFYFTRLESTFACSSSLLIWILLLFHEPLANIHKNTMAMNLERIKATTDELKRLIIPINWVFEMLLNYHNKNKLPKIVILPLPYPIIRSSTTCFCNFPWTYSVVWKKNVGTHLKPMQAEKYCH